MATALALAGFAGCAARADESGVSFWLPGQYGSFAAVAPSPGFSLPMVTYYYSGRAGANQILSLGSGLDLGVRGSLSEQFLTPSYAPDTTFLGGKPNFSLSIELAYATAGSAAQLEPAGPGVSGSLAGIGDLGPTAQLFWTSGVNNWMAYVAGNIPVGTYAADNLANIGIGHAAIDVGGAYTYLNKQSGWEFSATAGLTVNFENPSTNYTNGIDAHLDWGVAKFVNKKLYVGAVGYVYQQLTPDRGQPEILGDFRSRTIAFGPQIGYNFDAGGVEIDTNLRGYFEIDVENRLKGGGVFFSVNVPLSALLSKNKKTTKPAPGS